MARVAAAWSIKKGGPAWKVTEQIRISPAPKLGGWAGKQLRLLTVSRGQSVITDLEQGSLAVNRRSPGLPSMQRMWFHGQGFSLGYTKPRASPEPAELFFLGPDAKLWAQQRLPAPAIDAAAGTDQWFVACRNGRVHAFSLDGTPLWSELIPCARRDHATNEFWGLPVFHPRLHLAANSGLLAIGAEQQFHRYDPFGERIWSGVLPAVETSGPRTIAIDFPTREHRLARLGLSHNPGREQVRTGYLRLKLDTLLDTGWLKQVQVSDFETDDQAEAGSANPAVSMGVDCGFKPGVNIVRATWNTIVVGTQDGFVHIFDREGTLERSFQVGETAVTDLLVVAGGLRAAYCAGRLTLFERGMVSTAIELPEYFAELTDCGSGVLAWRSNSVWFIDRSGRVKLAAEAARPIRGVWGCPAGFYVLAGELSAFAGAPACQN